MHKMKRNSYLYLAIFFSSLLFIFPTLSQSVESPISSNDETVERLVLPNGMTVILKEVHTAPVVAMQMWCKAGSITEDKYLGDGISHFVEHMLFKGTEKRKVNQIAQEVRDAGGELNAYTSFDRIVFHIVVASRYFDTGLDCLADASMHSSFDAEELQKERQVILKEVNMNEDDPARVVGKLFWSTAYTQHPYRYPVIGYRDLVEKVTREQLVDYYKTVFVPDNLIFVVTGDFKISDARPKIEAAFKDFQRTIRPKVYIPEEPPQLGMRRAEIEQDVNQTYLEMGYHIPSITSEDVPPLDVLAIILGQGRSSRLYKEILTNQGLVHSIDAYSWTPAYPGIFGVSAVLDPAKESKTESAILKELDKIKAQKVTSEELNKAKKIVESNRIFDKQTIQDQCSKLGDDELTVGDINFSDEYIQRVRDVTTQDIQRVAKKYFTEENLTIAVLHPRAAPVAIEPGKTVKQDTSKTENGIQKYVLPNGMTLLLRENHSLPVVSMRVVFKGGVFYENQNNNGISNLMVNMLLKGTKTRKAEDIADQIAAVGGKIDTYSGNNSFGISIDTLPGDSDLGLNVLCDVLLNSTFPEDIVAQEKQRIIGNIRSQEDDPFTIASKLFRKTFFTTHPYHMTSAGTQESVGSIIRDDIIKFYHELIVPKNTVLAVYGDIQSAEMKAKIEKTFAKFNATSVPATPNVKVIPPTQVKEETAFKDKSQAIVLIGYPSIDVKSQDRYAFDVLNSVLSGQGARLFDAVREKQGLAYYVGAFNIVGLDPGAYVLYAGTVGEKVDFVTVSLLREVDKLRKAGPTDEEITRGKKELIGNKSIDLQTNGAVAFESAIDELYGLGYNNYLDYTKKIDAVTKQDITNIVQKYLKPNAYIVTIVRPPVKK